MHAPLALVVDDDSINVAFAERMLSRTGWIVTTAADGAQGVAEARAAVPALIVMDIDMPVLDGWAAVAAIRQPDHPASAAPILAFTTLKVADAELAARGFDGRVPKPCAPADFAAAIAPWRPNGVMEGFARLSSIFDATELEPLLHSLGQQLTEILEDEQAGRGQAHRIAGAAGTLGFAQVSEAWLAVSEGDESAYEGARREARRALAAIDRQIEEGRKARQ